MVMYLVGILKNHGQVKVTNPDPNAFLFSLNNKDNKPIKMKCINSDGAIYCSNNFGLMDLKISFESNLNNVSCSNIGYSYEHPDYDYDSSEAQ